MPSAAVSVRSRLHAFPEAQLDLGLDRLGPGRPEAGSVVESTVSALRWQALGDVYSWLGFDTVDDECFKQLVLARIVEPTSKSAALGVDPPSLRTITRTLRRIQARWSRKRR